MSFKSFNLSTLFVLVSILAITAVKSKGPDVAVEAQVPSGGQTAISMLHTNLLAGVPGYFLGNLSAGDVEQACRFLDIRSVNGLSIHMSVAALPNGTRSASDEDLTVTFYSSQCCRSRLNV